MSPFGIAHTAVSVLPLGFGLAAFLRHGRIDPKSRVGKLYLGTMLAGAISSWGFLPEKGFTPGQGLTLITLALLAVGVVTARGAWRNHGPVQLLSLSGTYLLLWVFTTTETLTRVPRGAPFAAGPTDPALIPVRLALLALFAAGAVYQVRAYRGHAKPALAGA